MPLSSCLDKAHLRVILGVNCCGVLLLRMALGESAEAIPMTGGEFGMFSPINTYAILTVARGCGFAGLATFCAMFGLVFDPPLALKFGGYSAMLTCAVLLLMAFRSPDVSYKKTETWLTLPHDLRPPAPVAQIIVGRARQRALFIFARVTAAFAAGCFLAAFLLGAWTSLLGLWLTIV